MRDPHDPWMDRLSEYLDGDLAPAEAQRLEEHVAGCAACLRTLGELRAVVAAAGSLDHSEPAADLWPGIAAAIAAGLQGERAGGVLELRPRRVPEERRPGARRGYAFSMPQLAAAAVLLMSLSAGAAWWLAGREPVNGPQTGTIVHVAGTASSSGRLVEAGAPDDPDAGSERAGIAASDIAELERTLGVTREQLDPATVEVIERSLEAIDQAIATARAALDADPGNPHLGRQLDNAMRKKLDILRRANHVQRAGI
jgi:anti-sigma factor RsiW